MAGCIGGDDDDDDGANSDGSPASYPDHADTWFTGTQVSFPAADYQWNPIVGWFIPHDQWGMFAQWTTYQVGEDEFYPHLIQEWEHDGGEMTLTMSEDFTWGNTGDPVTAEDLVLELEVRDAANHFAFDFVDDYEATGEYELAIYYEEGTNTDLIDYAILPYNADIPPSNWEGTDYESNPGDVDVSEPDSSGPVHLTDHTSQYSQTEVRDGLDGVADHYLGENYNWNGYRIEHRSGNNAAHNTFINSESDGQHSLFVPDETLAEFPDYYREIQIPGGFGVGLFPDHQHEQWGNQNVRQALMWSLDREAVIFTVGESSKIHHPAPNGLTAASMESWLGSMEPDGLYSYNRDDERAQELLDDAGYTRGEIDATITFPSSWSDWATACQSVVDQLNDSGWDASADSRSSGPGDYTTQDDWVIAADQHTQGGTPAMNHPYYSLRYILNNTLRDADEHFAGYLVDSDTVEIDGEEIDVMAQLEAFGETNERSEQEEIAMTLAEVVNKDVPVVILMEKYEQSFINTQRFDVPEDSPHFLTYWPLWWLPKVAGESLEGADTDGLMKATGN